MAQKTIPSGARRLAKTDYRNLMRRRIPQDFADLQ